MAPPNPPLLLTGRTASPRATRGGVAAAPQQSGRTFGGLAWCPGGAEEAPAGPAPCMPDEQTIPDEQTHPTAWEPLLAHPFEEYWKSHD